MHVAFLIAAHLLGLVHMVRGHGYMIDPPARASAWREFPALPRNYDDNAIRCGGQKIPADGHGRCGVCGDPVGAQRDNEAGGTFATGRIVRNYTMGQVITMKTVVTANHLGWFEFKICPNNDVRKPVTLECLDKHVLQRADGQGSRIYITTSRTGEYSADYKLPDGMVCSQCVVQWRYHTGNSWGVDRDGKACIGCGEQEEFYGCADVSIQGDQPGVLLRSTHPPTQALVPTQPPTLPPVRTIVPVTTHAPVLTTGHFVNPVPTQDPFKPRTGCHAINLWAGNPTLDQWCVDNCAINQCSPYGCSCGDASTTSTARTQPPTTTSTTTSTTTTKTTTSPTTTSTTTRPTTTSTVATTPQPNPPQTTYITKVVCKAINLWAGNDYLDRWCSDACARGNCPLDSCKCSEVQQVMTLSTTSNSPAVQYAKVCKAIDVWTDIDVFDIWCTENCNNENVCPPETCNCTDTPLFPMTRAATTPTPTTTLKPTPAPTPSTGCWSNGAMPGDDGYWNQWCQDTCDRGHCSVDYCICRFH